MIHFLHHYDRPNQGDVLSGPYNYFNFGEYKKISWDKNIIKNIPAEFDEGDSVIMGGGIYFAREKPRFDRLVKRSRTFIGWGLGLDPRLDLENFVGKFSLLGTRERKLHLIDNENIFYVPCVSCMNPVFTALTAIDATFGTAGANASDPSIALHLNGGFNKSEILEKIGDKAVPVTTTTDLFGRTVKNLWAADIVITNSYHGAYWSSLLGKKVICIKTDVPKWEGLHENIVFSTVGDIKSAVTSAQKVPGSYLNECRLLNSAFYERVVDLLAKEPAAKE